MLSLKETLNKMAKSNVVRWYGYVVRRDNDNLLKRTLMLEMKGQRRRGKPRQRWRRQVEENTKRIGLEMEQASNRTRWCEGVGAIAEEMRCIRPPTVTRKTWIKIR